MQVDVIGVVCWQVLGLMGWLSKRSGLEREAWECPGGKKTVGFCVVTWRTGGVGRTGGSGGLQER